MKGNLYDHYYPQIVDKVLWDACESVRLGWHKKPFQYRSKDYVFRGILTCAVTGKSATTDTKKKTYASGQTAEWTYLIVSDPDNPNQKKWVREDKV